MLPENLDPAGPGDPPVDPLLAYALGLLGDMINRVREQRSGAHADDGS